MDFYIVDAFSSAAFCGNPAGVVILENNQDFPSEDIMIKTAAELRYSETAFIKQIDDTTFHTKYFTPVAEVDLCGHATIAAFTVLKHNNLVKDSQTYVNKTLAGNLEIYIDDDNIMMEMATPKELGEIDTPQAIEEIYNIMGIKYERVVVHKAHKVIGPLLPKIISTGLPDIMLPVLDLEALASLAPDMNALSGLSSKYDVTGVHAFAIATENESATAHTRNFSPRFGIDEEAATGTASGALSFYLNQYDIIDDEDDFSFIQGEQLKRPSRIVGKIKNIHGQLKIHIGGTGVILAEGKIFI